MLPLIREGKGAKQSEPTGSRSLASPRGSGWLPQSWPLGQRVLAPPRGTPNLSALSPGQEKSKRQRCLAPPGTAEEPARTAYARGEDGLAAQKGGQSSRARLRVLL